MGLPTIFCEKPIIKIDQNCILLGSLLLLAAQILSMLLSYASPFIKFFGEEYAPIPIILTAIGAVVLLTLGNLYFIMIRRVFSWKLTLLLYLLGTPFSLICLGGAAVFTAAVAVLQKFDSELRNDVGYPSFLIIQTSYIRDTDEDSGELTFEDIRNSQRSKDLDAYKTIF